MTANECRCGRLTRDGFYFCETCGDSLSRALGECPWLDEQLDVTTTRTRGIDYRALGGARATERPAPVHWAASDARGNLKAMLVSWARFCEAEEVRNSSPRTAPLSDDDDTIPALSRWLMWRVDGLALLDIGPEAVDEITDAVAACHRLIDRHPERQYLGSCAACEGGRIYARPGAKVATCDACDAGQDAEQVRTRLLAQLDDRLCTAAEIAHLSTYLGLKDGRDQVRKRINQWHKRKLIESHAAFSDDPTFRFGEVYERLVAAEYDTRKASTASA